MYCFKSTNTLKLFLAVTAYLFCSCNSKDPVESKEQPVAQTSQPQEKPIDLSDRSKLTGDFNGDNIQDTLFESYISALTNKETLKLLDSNDFEKNIDLIIKNKPITRLRSSIKGIDPFIVSSEGQQAGISILNNLGDLNDDKTDEFGYAVNWVDYSNINTYHIVTLKNSKFVELLHFQINEALTYEEDNLIERKYLIKKIAPKTIEYMFYSDTATVEKGTQTFE